MQHALGTHDTMLFDGDCGICSKSAELCTRIARRTGYRVIPYQAVEEAELRRFGTDYTQCGRRIHTITRNGRVYSGAFALNHFCWRHVPWIVLPIIIYLLPPLLVLEIVAYEIVAHNRHRISRALGLTACAVHRA